MFAKYATRIDSLIAKAEARIEEAVVAKLQPIIDQRVEEAIEQLDVESEVVSAMQNHDFSDDIDSYMSYSFQLDQYIDVEDSIENSYIISDIQNDLSDLQSKVGDLEAANEV